MPSRPGALNSRPWSKFVAKLLRAWPVLLLLTGVSEGHREALESVLLRHGLAVLLEGADGTLHALGAPGIGARLLEQLVAQQLAGRRPGGTFALIAT